MGRGSRTGEPGRPRRRARASDRPFASPVLHRATFAALGLEDSEYGRAEVGDEDLAAFRRPSGGDGLLLTMPLKERLVALARERGWDLDETAEATGVANTLVRFPNATTVANTDVDGIVGAIRLRPGSGTRATILGAGATARSAPLALVRLGITEVDLLVRAPPVPPPRPSSARASGSPSRSAVSRRSGPPPSSSPPSPPRRPPP